MAINYNGDISVVLDMQHRTPGKPFAGVSCRADAPQHPHRQIVRRALQLDRKNRAGADDHHQNGISYKDGQISFLTNPENYEIRQTLIGGTDLATTKSSLWKMRW